MDLLSKSGFMPHGHCYLWKPELLWTITGSDLLIGLSYVSISISLVYLVWRARLPFQKVFLAFGLFIAACGAGHFLDIVTTWHPYYWLTAVFRVVTAIASILSAVATVFMLPRIIATIRDVSLSEKRGQMLHLLVQGVKDYAIFMIDSNGRVVSWNDGAARISGHSENEIIGKHYSIFYPPEDAQNGLPEEALKLAFTQGRFEGEGWRMRKDGTRFCASFVLTAIRDSNGNHQGFAKVIRDITDKRKAEDDLRLAYEKLERRVLERTEELRASQMGLEELMNTVNGVVWEAEIGKPRFSFVSRQAERILGYPIERWLGEEKFWQNILHPEDRERMTGDKYLSPAEKRDSQIEYRVKTADGRTIWIKDYIKIIYERGTPAKMRGIMVDITDRKNVEEQLRTAREVAIQASTVKSEFVANMSHEIRTPLNAIIGMATIAQEGEMSEDRRDCLVTIKTAADTLLSLINDILDFSKIEAGKVSLEISDFELKSVCANALDVITPIAKGKNIDIEVQTSGDLPQMVRGDPGRLLQILLNLLGNAVKFTPVQGRVLLLIKRVSETMIRFEVSDTGPGVPEKIRDRLFQPFSQADSSTARKYGGTGLGLSICKRLVDLMKGQIGLECQHGVGSTFWFELPLPAAGGAKSQEQCADAIEQVESAPVIGARILVAEDNPANRKVVLRFLEKLGHRADVVADGKEAVESFRMDYFDLIFMDCQMPEMDGYEATRRIRELERQSGRLPIPIVALTAHAFSGDEKKCREAGMDDYVTKPVDLKRLEQIISKWTRRKELATKSAIDLDYLKGLDVLQSEGLPDIVCELIDLFLSSGPGKIQVMGEALQARDFELLRKTAHCFKSTCHNVGAKDLASLCQQIEDMTMDAACTEKTKELEQLLSWITRDNEQASAQLREQAKARSVGVH